MPSHQEIEHISRLLFKEAIDELNDREEQELAAWKGLSDMNRLFAEELTGSGGLWRDTKRIMSGKLLADTLLLEAGVPIRPIKMAPVHRVHFLKTAWFRYAAAALIFFAGAGLYFYLEQSPNKQVAVVKNSPHQPDIAAGGNKATLTLADGSVIVLDSAANGSLAEQGNMRVVKSANGQLIYDLRANGGTGHKKASPGAQTISYNTISTPKGGQYQITLPDGSKVWLNAASSVRFPTAFEAQRTVAVTGEVYFEIAPHKNRPFLVSAGKVEVQVLGTSFNVNAYADEEAVKTTLIEGSVRVGAYDHLQILTPGQQVQAKNDGSLYLEKSPDLGQVTAWKYGIFNFNKVSLKQAMRQIAKWYDVEVIYEGEVPAISFWGEMGRNLSLSELLQLLSQMGVHFRLEEGRRLVVTP